MNVKRYDIKPYIQLFFGFIGLLLLGLAYAWSLFVGPLEAEFGWTRSQTSLTFSISMICFCLGGTLGSVIKIRWSEKVTFLLCGIFFLVGFVMCSRTDSLLGLYIGYGVLCGLATGMSYNNIISSVNSWFPDKTGVISGIMMMGYGFGSFLLGFTITRLHSMVGWRSTYFIFGIIFCCLLLAMFIIIKSDQMKEEAATTADTEQSISPGQMLRMPTFYKYYFWGTIISIIGLSLIGHASLAAATFDVPETMIVFTTGCLSVANGIYRIISGIVYDRYGRKINMLSGTWIMIVGCAILYAGLYTKIYALLFLSYLLIGSSYGNACIANSAFVKEYFGAKFYGVNFSIVVTTGIPASLLGPYIIGIIQTYTNSYLSAFLIFIPFLVLAYILQMLIPSKNVNK